jgi:DNA-binding CsgD family transcriptional regulator
MGKQGFLISRNSLNYILLDHTLVKNNFTEEYETLETPSTFYLNLRYSDEIYLPVTIFQNKLTPFQNIIKYLRENRNLTNRKIALLLTKDIKTIWATYKAVEKEKALIEKQEAIQIPLTIFKATKLSPLEAIVQFLKKLGFNYAEISRLLNKDQRTIWTVYARAKNKMSTEANGK